VAICEEKRGHLPSSIVQLQEFDENGAESTPALLPTGSTGSSGVARGVQDQQGKIVAGLSPQAANPARGGSRIGEVAGAEVEEHESNDPPPGEAGHAESPEQLIGAPGSENLVGVKGGPATSRAEKGLGLGDVVEQKSPAQETERLGVA
jgi:hypothetical protein